MERSLLCLFYCFFGLCLSTPTVAAAATVPPDRKIITPAAESPPESRGPYFETKRAAKAYRRRHGPRGKIRQQSDGTYAIETATGSIQRDPQTAALVYPGRGRDGVVFATLVTAPALETNSALRAGPDKIAPLSFWQRLNGGRVDGAHYGAQGYYIQPAIPTLFLLRGVAAQRTLPS